MKKNKFVCLVCMMSLISLTFLIGCQQEESFEEVYDNGDYLSLSPNVNYDQLTDTDLEILSEAFVRLDIRTNEDGLFDITQKSGKDINISEELFNYFHLIAENTNERILSDIQYSRNIVQTRQEGLSSGTDCVAYSIAFATGQDVGEIDSWITSQYGNNGVSSEKFYSVMRHFNENGVQVSCSMFNHMTINDKTTRKYIIVLNYSHAVNVVQKNGNNIMYYDAQNRRHFFCTTLDVTHIYELR